ncbi:MAG: DUF4349 domain-containing protein, partial [Dehalococcoidales bacterium]|nr:DUF4349 domain-containing protein [Dehalococcoidales bacterium]
MKKPLVIGIISALVICLLATVSCASKAATTTSYQMGLDERNYYAVTTTAAPAPTVAVPGKVSDGGYSSQEASSDTGIEQMIVRTSNMNIVVEDVSVVMDQIAQLAESSGGYVVSSYKYLNGERLTGTISIRVPAGDFDSAMATIQAMADEVTSENTTAQDVT